MVLYSSHRIPTLTNCFYAENVCDDHRHTNKYANKFYSILNACLLLRFQPVDATHWLNRSAGVR